MLPHTNELAKGWLLALLEQAPLDDAPVILAAELTRDGPRLCDAVLRAIADDIDLRRLQPSGALTQLAARVGALAGASGPEGASRAVDALHAVIWTALRDQLTRPDPELVAALSERLTRVVELLRGATLRSSDGPPSGELASVRLPRRGSGPERRPEIQPVGRSGPVAPEPAVVPESNAAGADTPAEPAQAPCLGALEEEIQRSAGSPLALLLAELEEAERVATVESDAVASFVFGGFARVMRSVVRHQDILISETDTRAWIIARDTDRSGAQSLGSRIADAARTAGPWRGAPLTASVGLAVLGEDGLSSHELVEAAEVARYTAAARGVNVSGAAAENASGPG